MNILSKSVLLIAATTIVTACGGGSGSPSNTPSFAVGGAISGLTASGLLAQINGLETVAVDPKAKTFGFPTSLLMGSSYVVSIKSQPAWQWCKTDAAAGTVGQNSNTAASISCGIASTVVGTFAGGGAPGASNPGSADGIGTSATFNQPLGVAFDKGGNLYVADFGNNRIRKITPDGAVGTLAGGGSVGGVAAGAVDGNGTAATFNSPEGVAADSLGNVYVADTFNNLIRKITPMGVVSTLAGGGTPGGTKSGYADDVGSKALFNGPTGVAVDQGGNVFVADNFNHLIRKITPAGLVSTVAGGGMPSGTASGHADGVGTAATFFQPEGIVLDSAGNLYVADSVNNLIRLISPDGVVKTIAGGGSPGGTAAGSADGAGTAATFNYPLGIALDGFGNVFVVDDFNKKIRLIDSTGVTFTLAGTGSHGSSDGPGPLAGFSNPFGIAVGTDGVAYVGDWSNHRIRTLKAVQP